MQAAASASIPVEFGKSWQGQTVDGRFPLQQYLGGSENHATFLTVRENARAIIKLYSPGDRDPEAQLALWRRATQLEHPHLLRIFESGRCWLSGKELLYVVMEYGDENLADVLPHRALTSAEAEAMLRPTLEALSFLHSHGLVHAHLKPSNILAVRDQLKLSSDGIRSAEQGTAVSTDSIHDAPEFSKGQLSDTGDVWSLGVTLIEVLTRQASRTAGKGDYTSLPQPFDDIVRHCVRDDPNERWTVADISARLQPEPITSSPRKQEASQPNHGQGHLKFITAVVVLLALIVAGVLIARRSSNSRQPQATSAQPAASQPVAPPASTNVPENAGGTVLHRVLPTPSASALRTIHGRIKVRVRVNVDATGNVTNARFLTAGPSKYFARLSMEAAQQWKFSPPTANGQSVPSEWILLCEFSRGGVTASAEQAKSPR